MRDRLIELLNECQHAYDKEVGEAIKENRIPIGENAFYAGHLLAAGCILPPCKVGDVVYKVVDTMEYEGVIEMIVTSMEIYITDEGVQNSCSYFTAHFKEYPSIKEHIDYIRLGDTVFLTKEIAEEALKNE